MRPTLNSCHSYFFHPCRLCMSGRLKQTNCPKRVSTRANIYISPFHLFKALSTWDFWNHDSKTLRQEPTASTIRSSCPWVFSSPAMSNGTATSTKTSHAWHIMASFHPLAVSPIERTHTSPSARTGETASRHRPIGGSVWPAGRVSALFSWFSLASVWCNTMQLGVYSQGSYRKRKMQNTICSAHCLEHLLKHASLASLSCLEYLGACGVVVWCERDMSIHVQGTLLRLPVSSDFAACHHHKLVVKISWIEIMIQRSGWKPAWLEKNGPMKLKDLRHRQSSLIRKFNETPITVN